jgi:uncharacterized protein (DUF305 family)
MFVICIERRAKWMKLAFRLTVAGLLIQGALCASGQSGAVTVQPGAPGQNSKVISAAGAAKLPPASDADVNFMQGMIMHHGQAVEMTSLIAARSKNPEVKAIGAKISLSQTDELKFMKNWLKARGKSEEMPMDMDMGGMDMSKMSSKDMADMMPRMPGMLSPLQMNALRNSSGAQFDHLFLAGMIQHHTGALTMVKDLFDTSGAGQDADLFNFATDVDNTQRAEIKIMQDMLSDMSKKEKR